MKRTLLIIFLILYALPCASTETKYGLELAPSHFREKHLKHFMSLFHEFCFGQSSQMETKRNIISSNLFRPAPGFDGIYEKFFNEISYAVTPDENSCTVDVLLEYKSGKLLFSLDEVQAAIINKSDYLHQKSINTTEEGPNSEAVMTIESHFQNTNKTNDIILTYPTSNQDVFYMTLDYNYK